MSTKLKPETIRIRVKKDLELKLKQAGIDLESKSERAGLYQSKADEYMEMYDHRRELQLASEEPDMLKKKPRLYMDITKEIRQLDKSMRDLLDWLGVDPKAEAPKEENYDL